MKIVFNRQGKKHVCSTCFRPFDWSANSWRFGRMEYETISQERKEEKVFCSDGCKRRYLRKNKTLCQKIKVLRWLKMRS